jgi:ACS family D-galactonate transporter-like MFS transporter
MATVLPSKPQLLVQARVTSWRILPLVMIVVALAHFNRVSISTAGTERIISREGIGEVEMGTVYSAFLFVYTVFMIPGGWFIDRYGPRAAWLVLGFGSTAFVTLTGITGMLAEGPAELLLGLLVVRSALGLVNAPLHPTGARLVANWMPPSGAALANGLVTSAACVGMASTYLVFGALLDEVGWRWAFVLTGGITLVIALIWAVAGADYPAGGRPAEVGPWQQGLGQLVRLLTNRGLVCLTLSYGALSYFQYLFFYWSEFYFERQMGLSTEMSRAGSSLLTLAMGAGMVLGGWLSDWARRHFGSRRGLALLPMVGLTVSAVALAAGLLVQESAGAVAAFTLAMAAAGMAEGAFWTAALHIGGEYGGTAASIMNTGGNGVGLLAPILTPLVSDWLGWRTGLGLAGVACLIGAVLWLPIQTVSPQATDPG